MIFAALMGRQRSLRPPLPLDGAMHQRLPSPSPAPTRGVALLLTPGQQGPLSSRTRGCFLGGWKNPRGVPGEHGSWGILLRRSEVAWVLCCCPCFGVSGGKSSRMGSGFGTHLPNPRVWACPEAEVFISGDRWGRRIIESLRLEKTSKIIKSNCHSITTMAAKPCPEVSHLDSF